MSPSTTCLTCGRLIGRGQSYCHAHKPRNGSTRQWRALRAQILARDRWTCRLCGEPATHVDHKHAITHGGSDQPGNLQATCQTCNLAKGSRGAPNIPNRQRPADIPPPVASGAARLRAGSAGDHDGR